jgi:hypothetical protein
MRSSSPAARASGPTSARSRSVSIRSMNAAVIVRCSASLLRSRTCARAATGMQPGISRLLTSPTSGARPRSTYGGPASRIVVSFGPPTMAGSSMAASVGVSPISPASAIPSMTSVSLIAGPAMSSSRWTLPAMKKWNVPVPMPTDIRRMTVPPPAWMRPTRSIVRCISHAARAARSGCCGPSNIRRSASPPHFRRPAPQSYASSSSAVKTPSSVSRMISAPTLPFLARRSVSAVKPEISTKTRVASTSRCIESGVWRSQSMTSRGTYGFR